MTIRLAVLLVLTVALSASGCSRLQHLVEPQPQWKAANEEGASVPPVQETGAFESYFGDLQTLSEVELEREFGVIKKRFAASPGEEDRWRLIYLSLMPEKPFSNRQYALDLLRARSKEQEPENASREAMGKLLSLLLTDLKEVERKWSQEKERADKLSRQLNELKEIEKILGEREKKRP